MQAWPPIIALSVVDEVEGMRPMKRCSGEDGSSSGMVFEVVAASSIGGGGGGTSSSIGIGLLSVTPAGEAKTLLATLVSMDESGGAIVYSVRELG